MKYEVINLAGNVVMWTEHPECVPDTDELKRLSDIGYKHKVNGKIVSAAKVHEMLGAGESKPAPEKTTKGFKKWF